MFGSDFGITDGAITLGVITSIVREVMQHLKDRGIDFRAQQETCVDTHRMVKGLDPFRLNDMVKELHDMHLGPNAFHPNGSPKSWVDHDTLKLLVETQRTQTQQITALIALQKSTNELLAMMVKKDL